MVTKGYEGDVARDSGKEIRGVDRTKMTTAVNRVIGACYTPSIDRSRSISIDVRNVGVVRVIITDLRIPDPSVEMLRSWWSKASVVSSDGITQHS